MGIAGRLAILEALYESKNISKEVYKELFFKIINSSSEEITNKSTLEKEIEDLNTMGYR